MVQLDGSLPFVALPTSLSVASATTGNAFSSPCRWRACGVAVALCARASQTRAAEGGGGAHAIVPAVE